MDLCRDPQFRLENQSTTGHLLMMHWKKSNPCGREETGKTILEERQFTLIRYKIEHTIFVLDTFVQQRPRSQSEWIKIKSMRKQNIHTMLESNTGTKPVRGFQRLGIETKVHIPAGNSKLVVQWNSLDHMYVLEWPSQHPNFNIIENKR